jgi:predicted  nucleic acid-binding Zn-ribbon protein
MYKFDMDGDGVVDRDDAFPNNPVDYKDTDGDGMGNSIDDDDDGDGTPDVRDAFPLNKNEWMDTDGDGTGDNADSDDDNDGVADNKDAFPKNPREYMDSDSDGIGDWLDPDDDNDGTADVVEWENSVNARFGNLDNAVSLALTTIRGDLADVKTDLEATMDGMETNIITEIGDLNTALSADIQSGVDNITMDLAGMNASLAADLMAVKDDILADNDALETWLDLVLTALETEMDEANRSMHEAMTDLSDNIDDYYTTLDADMMEVMRQLAASEANLSDENLGLADDIAVLSQLMQDLNAETLDDLSAKLRDIAGNLSTFDEATAGSLSSLADDIDEFSQQTRSDTDEIDTTLEDLAKLDQLITDLEALNSDLEATEQSISDDVKTTHDEEMGRSLGNMMLSGVVLVLIIIVILLLIMVRKDRNEYVPPPPPGGPDPIPPVMDDLEAVDEEVFVERPRTHGR